MTPDTRRNSLEDSQSWWQRAGEGWERFWFTPAAPQTLALIRICGGAMLFYTHLIWSLRLADFVGPHAWISADVSRALQRDSFVWTYWWHVESPWLMWTLHLAALAIFAMLTCGLFTRVVSVFAFAITLAYCHRLNGSLFGLDQVNAMLAMYLLVGASGDAYSLDRWRHQRQGRGLAAPRVSTNVAIRLMQLHLCVIYLFGGIGKMRGEMWWDGSAVWYSIANYEYQSWDVTWLGHWPLLIAMLTHVTVFWETFYCVLIWPRLTRPIALAIAVGVHGGIALVLGMPTFGFAMLIANLSFVSPERVHALVTRMLAPFRVPDAAREASRAGESRGGGVYSSALRPLA